MSKNRVEAFSDGVFAIAATLLILEIRLGDGNLASELLEAWPRYAAYAITFLSIGVMWIQHHAILHLMSHVNRSFLLINLFFLMLIAFLPFPTGLVAEHLKSDDARPAVLAYGISFTVTAIAFNALWHSARRVLRPDAPAKEVRGITRTYAIGPFTSMAATLTALVSPYVCMTILGALTLLYVFESSWFSGSEGGGDEDLGES